MFLYSVHSAHYFEEILYSDDDICRQRCVLAGSSYPLTEKMAAYNESVQASFQIHLTHPTHEALIRALLMRILPGYLWS